MKKYLFIVLLLAVNFLPAFCQTIGALRIDSLRLDSAKQSVRLLKGSARVDLLNDIALRTGYISPHAHRIDTSFLYATEALNEATTIGYRPGVAMALIILSASSKDSTLNMPGKDDATKERDIRKAIQIGEETNNNEVLGWGYYYLGDMSLTKDLAKMSGYLQRSMEYFLKANDTLHAAECANWLCTNYEYTGEYERSFDYGRKSLELSKRGNTDFSLSWQQFLEQYSLSSMYDLYTDAGDYEEAMNYLHAMDQFGKDHKGNEWDIVQFTADLFYKMGRYDSALVYINRWINNGAWVGGGKGHQAIGWAILAQIYLDSTKQYDKAIELFTKWGDTLKKYHSTVSYAETGNLISIGQAYDEKRDYTTALQYAKQGVDLAQEKNQRPIMMHGYKVLSSIYYHLGKSENAYKYLLKYNTIRDSIQNRQFLLRIYNAKKDAEIEKKQAQVLLLDADNKIQGQQLKRDARQTNLLFILLSVLVLAGVFVYRSIYLKRKNERLRFENDLTVERLENERKHAVLKRQAADLQLQALRAQMNPHFIFNSLSSINWFIMENDKDTASDYLTRFSRLMRMILNSQKPTIPLDDELKMLQLYLDLERLRLEFSFDYSITFNNALDAGTVSIPPMLLQPFCENAIWHGFMNKEGKGHININISTDEYLLKCVITDDGIGRKQAAAFKKRSAKKGKSMGLEITRERLALFCEENNAEAFFKIEDLENDAGASTGTRVILKIACKELAGETV